MTIKGRRLADLGIFARAWVLLLAAELALRALPFARAERLLAARPARRTATESEVRRRVWATRAAARRHLLPVRCLPQALCLRRLLAGAGIHADLRIGVRREGEALGAHAWVEVAGRPVGELESVGESFAPFTL